jgi:hypothetical protein
MKARSALGHLRRDRSKDHGAHDMTNTRLNEESVSSPNARPLRELKWQPMRGERMDAAMSGTCAQANAGSLRSGSSWFARRAAVASANWNARNQVRRSRHKARAARGCRRSCRWCSPTRTYAAPGGGTVGKEARVSPPFRCQSRAQNAYSVIERVAQGTLRSSPRSGRATGRHKPTAARWDEALRASRSTLASSPRSARSCVTNCGGRQRSPAMPSARRSTTDACRRGKA